MVDIFTKLTKFVRGPSEYDSKIWHSRIKACAESEGEAYAQNFAK